MIRVKCLFFSGSMLLLKILVSVVFVNFCFNCWLLVIGSVVVVFFRCWVSGWVIKLLSLYVCFVVRICCSDVFIFVVFNLLCLWVWIYCLYKVWNCLIFLGLWIVNGINVILVFVLKVLIIVLWWLIYWVMLVIFRVLVIMSLL